MSNILGSALDKTSSSDEGDFFIFFIFLANRIVLSELKKLLQVDRNHLIHCCGMAIKMVSSL